MRKNKRRALPMTPEGIPRLTNWDDIGLYMRELARLGYDDDAIVKLTSEAVDKLPLPRRRRPRIVNGTSLRGRDVPRCDGGVDCRSLPRFAVTDRAGTIHYCCYSHFVDRIEGQEETPTIERFDLAPNRRAAAHGRTEYLVTLTPVRGALPLQLF